MPAEPVKFAELFQHPTVEAMHALSPRDFERFVAYVLRRAGYDVREVGPHWLKGVDLELRLPGKTHIIGGVECKRFAPDNLVSASIVQHVRGASSVSKPGAKPFVITTSDFKDTAHAMAESGSKQVYLVNGQQLVRYNTYIQGSRNDDDDVISSLSPEFFAGRDKAPTAHGATILTIANNKGGVGKTTTAYYLGVEFARQGKRVLLIDFDGQGNLTERCIPKHLAALTSQSNQMASIVQYFAGERSLTDLIIPSETPGVSLIPSDPFLTLRDLGGSGRPDIESRVVRDVQAVRMKVIASLGGAPDWIILDTPPAMSVFTRAGLAAADYVLAPVRPRPASLSGTRNMLLALRTMDALTGTNGRFLGTALTHWDTLELTRRFAEINLPQALQGYLQEFGGHVLQIKIPIDNQLETLEPGAKTGGAEAYTDLAHEITRLIQLKRQSQV
ncbi:MAG TPA: AAA family ATPase [Ktedonobacterales bacterium]|nr:AAA family ATPase [Ktedonobacterales bacterium]